MDDLQPLTLACLLAGAMLVAWMVDRIAAQSFEPTPVASERNPMSPPIYRIEFPGISIRGNVVVSVHRYGPWPEDNAEWTGPLDDLIREAREGRRLMEAAALLLLETMRQGVPDAATEEDLAKAIEAMAARPWRHVAREAAVARAHNKDAAAAGG